MPEQRHLRILVLEDNPHDLFLLRAALTRVGFDTVELVHVERLSDGLRFLRQATVDLILTDLNLPDSTGPETVRTLAREAGAVPILVLTGYSDPDLEGELRQQGASGQVPKDLLHTTILGDSIKKVLRD